jgi:hypothetical protein
MFCFNGYGTKRQLGVSQKAAVILFRFCRVKIGTPTLRITRNAYKKVNSKQQVWLILLYSLISKNYD